MQRTIWAAMMVAALLIPAPSAAADSLEAILEQQRALQQDLEGDRMPDLTRRQINAVRKAQAQVFALTDGKSALDDLTIEEKVKLDNALERINAELAHSRSVRADEDQCRREKRTGTTLQSTQCATAGEREQLRESSRNMLERPRICEGVCG